MSVQPSNMQQYARPALFCLALGALAIWMCYSVQRPDFHGLIGSYSLFFGLYLVILYLERNASVPVLGFYVLAGLAIRGLLLGSSPNLSEDVWRFLWDGRLIINGIHPFAHPPVYFVGNGLFPPGITPELYALLNSKQWFSVYPPVCQAVFTAAAWLSPTDNFSAVLWMKVFLWCCEMGTLGLLWRLKHHQAAFWWALNPLVLTEIVGNGHFEGALVFFLLLGLHGLYQKKTAWSAVAWSLAVCVKLWPLMFLPLVLRWLGLRAGVLFLGVFTLTTALLFWPMLDFPLLRNMATSLDLYFQKFAFNGSVYYIFWEIGLEMKYYKLDKLVGLLLLPFPLLLIAFWSLRLRPHDAPERLFRFLLYTFAAFLVFSSTVHPWYLTVLFALSLWADAHHSDHPKQYLWLPPLLWTGVVMLSYSHYENNTFVEQKILIGLEYAVVVFSRLVAMHLKKPGQ
jgi:alpha-1,6-mannosyltransferase